MATLLEQANVALSAGVMRPRVAAAIANAAEDIENEDPATPNHEARLAWAESMLAGGVWNADPATADETDKIMWRVGLNPTIAAAGENATDNDIQFVVNSLLDMLIGA